METVLIIVRVAVFVAGVALAIWTIDQALRSFVLPRSDRAVLTNAYLAPDDGWLVVDASSPKRADDVVSLLGRSISGLATEPFVQLCRDSGVEQPARSIEVHTSDLFARRGKVPGLGLLLFREQRRQENAGDTRIAVRLLDRRQVREQLQAVLGKKARRHLSRR